MHVAFGFSHASCHLATISSCILPISAIFSAVAVLSRARLSLRNEKLVCAGMMG
jgi:hypothetical protein